MTDSSPEFRYQLAADRRVSLQRSGEYRPAGALRRVVGSGLVRLGLRLGYDVREAHREGRTVFGLPSLPSANRRGRA
jgi:hypothetical protein